jgi:hypothetical protein
VIGRPPEFNGAAHEITACPSENETEMDAGAPGIVAGTTAAESDEEEPVPALFVAVTVNV